MSNPLEVPVDIRCDRVNGTAQNTTKMCFCDSSSKLIALGLLCLVVNLLTIIVELGDIHKEKEETKYLSPALGKGADVKGTVGTVILVYYAAGAVLAMILLLGAALTQPTVMKISRYSAMAKVLGCIIVHGYYIFWASEHIGKLKEQEALVRKVFKAQPIQQEVAMADTLRDFLMIFQPDVSAIPEIKSPVQVYEEKIKYRTMFMYFYIGHMGIQLVIESVFIYNVPAFIDAL